MVGEAVAASIAGNDISIWNSKRLRILELLTGRGKGTFSDLGCARLLYCVSRHTDGARRDTEFNWVH